MRSSIAPKDIQHGISHAIVTQGQSVIARTRRLAPEKLKATKLEFEFMLQQGLCRPFKSCWASPLHLVFKKNGDWGPCSDYRKLNAITQSDCYPINNIISVGLCAISAWSNSIFNNLAWLPNVSSKYLKFRSWGTSSQENVSPQNSCHRK